MAVAFGAALITILLVAVLAGFDEIIAAFGIGLAVWLIIGALSELAGRVQLGKVSPSISFRRFIGLPRSAFGMVLAHLGIGVTVLGVVVASTWQTEEIVQMSPGQTVEVAGFNVRFEGFLQSETNNYTADRYRFTVSRAGEVVTTMSPDKRFYAARDSVTTEAAIRTFGFSHLYISPGDVAGGNALTVRLFWKPLVTLIWLGSLFMVAGGILSLSDRRLRVGAPKASRRRREIAAAE